MNKTYVLLFSLLAILCTACTDYRDRIPEPVSQTGSTTATYYNLAGHWLLISYNGHELEHGTYMILSFERREHKFQMYDNLQSMYGQKRTGTYILTTDDDTHEVTLSGFYDNGVGTWNHEYIITMLGQDKIQLVTTDKPKETNILVRIPNNPFS